MTDYVLSAYKIDGHICRTDWILSGVYFAINIPQFYAPYPFIAYTTGCWKDSYESRTAMRRACFYINMKIFLGIIFLIVTFV